MIYRSEHGRTRSAGKEHGQEISCFYALNKTWGVGEGKRKRERKRERELPCESWTTVAMSFQRGAVGYRRKNGKGCQINFIESINSFVTWERNSLREYIIKRILFLCIHIRDCNLSYSWYTFKLSGNKSVFCDKKYFRWDAHITSFYRRLMIQSFLLFINFHHIQRSQSSTEQLSSDFMGIDMDTGTRWLFQWLFGII